jgi:hypothetical protein
MIIVVFFFNFNFFLSMHLTLCCLDAGTVPVRGTHLKKILIYVFWHQLKLRYVYVFGTDMGTYPVSYSPSN